ncbi:pyridoxal phosphate-dependent aminotransferase [Candidatus Kuenenbacteria bacterium]|nr:pyridoxal phosphate-dependent aminotransferase [Candidatus Kuenenbacteria bacterium]
MSNKLKLSNRVNDLMSSPIRKFWPLVMAAEKRGVEVLKLNIGDPDIPPPAEIVRGIKNIKAQNLGYAPSGGMVENVDAWRDYYKKFGIKLERENIIPTVGASEAILLAFLAVADSEEEILVFEPLYASYKGLAKMAGVNLKPVTLRLENNFQLLETKEIEKKISKKTRAIVIINPDNPTGKVWSARELETISQLAEKYNLYLIVDETYREIVFRGKLKNILTFAKTRERTILIDSVSKRFSVPGIRLGAVVSFNKEIMGAILKIAMVRLSAPSVGQLATIEILKQAKKYTDKIRKEYQKRSQVALKELQKMSGVVFRESAGAFYQVVKLPIKDSEDFIRFMLEKFSYKNKTVLVSPMADFYITPGLGQNEIRLAYVLESKKLKEGVEILGRGLKEYLNK